MFQKKYKNIKTGEKKENPEYYTKIVIMYKDDIAQAYDLLLQYSKDTNVKIYNREEVFLVKVINDLGIQSIFEKYQISAKFNAQEFDYVMMERERIMRIVDDISGQDLTLDELVMEFDRQY